MRQRIAARPIISWLVTLIGGMVIGMLIVGQVDAAAPGPPGGLDVSEQNLDSDGNIKVHEQGVADVNVTNGSLAVDVVFPGEQDVNVTNSSLTVEGSVSAAQLGTWDVGIVGTPTVNVGNFPGGSTPASGSPGIFTLEVGGTTTETVAVPAGFVVTDLIGAFASTGGTNNCLLTVTDDGGTILYQSFFDDENVSLNLTTGLTSPLTATVRAAGTPGDRCRGTLFWTGFATP